MPFPLSSTLPACFAWCVEPPIAAARVAALEEAWRDALAAWLGGLDHPRDGQVQDNTDYLYVKGGCHARADSSGPYLLCKA